VSSLAPREAGEYVSQRDLFGAHEPEYSTAVVAQIEREVAAFLRGPSGDQADDGAPLDGRPDLFHGTAANEKERRSILHIGLLPTIPTVYGGTGDPDDEDADEDNPEAAVFFAGEENYKNAGTAMWVKVSDRVGHDATAADIVEHGLLLALDDRSSAETAVDGQTFNADGERIYTEPPQSAEPNDFFIRGASSVHPNRALSGVALLAFSVAHDPDFLLRGARGAQRDAEIAKLYGDYAWVHHRYAGKAEALYGRHLPTVDEAVETIIGDLCRAEDGKFSSCGGGASPVSDARVLSASEAERFSAGGAYAGQVFYHATTALDAVQTEGLKSKDELDALKRPNNALGGGSTDTVSFTPRKEFAENVAQTVRDAIDIAQSQQPFATAQARLSALGVTADDWKDPELWWYGVMRMGFGTSRETQRYDIATNRKTVELSAAGLSPMYTLDDEVLRLYGVTDVGSRFSGFLFADRDTDAVYFDAEGKHPAPSSFVRFSGGETDFKDFAPQDRMRMVRNETVWAPAIGYQRDVLPDGTYARESYRALNRDAAHYQSIMFYDGVRTFLEQRDRLPNPMMFAPDVPGLRSMDRRQVGVVAAVTNASVPARPFTDPSEIVFKSAEVRVVREGSRRMRESSELCAAQLLAEAVETIVGDLCRAEDGRFTSCGGQNGVLTTTDAVTATQTTAGQMTAADAAARAQLETAKREQDIRAAAQTPMELEHAALLARYDVRASEALRDGDSRMKFAVPAGMDAHGNMQYTWSPERAALHDRIIMEAMVGVEPREHPVLVLMGGLPGAGKTTSAGQGLRFEGKLVVNADDIKAKLPEYAGYNASYLHEESTEVTEKMMELGREMHADVVLDATMKSYDGAKLRAQTFKDAGYRIESRFVDVDIDTSVSRAVKRLADGDARNGQGRYVPLAAIRASASKDGSTKPRQTFDRLRAEGVFDAYLLVDNRGKSPVELLRHGQLTESAAWARWLEGDE